jgi:hypothetical protein
MSEKRTAQVVMRVEVVHLLDTLRAIRAEDPGAMVHIDLRAWRVVRIHPTGAERNQVQEHGEIRQATSDG